MASKFAPLAFDSQYTDATGSIMRLTSTHEAGGVCQVSACPGGNHPQTHCHPPDYEGRRPRDMLIGLCGASTNDRKSKR